jgi:hypothetical protein
MLYAFHYHGEAAPEAPDGGSLFSQTVAEAGLPHLQSFFSILKRVTAAPVRRAPARGKRRAATTTRSAGSKRVADKKRS